MDPAKGRRAVLVLVPGLVFSLLAASAMAQAPQTQRERTAAAEQKKKVARARERCQANRGTDCDTPEGLKEWLLQERSRAEALRDGSRARRPPPN